LVLVELGDGSDFAPPVEKRQSQNQLKQSGVKLGRTPLCRWFLVQIKEIVDFEEELAGAKK